MRFSSVIGAVALAATACGKELAKDAARAAGMSTLLPDTYMHSIDIS